MTSDEDIKKPDQVLVSLSSEQIHELSEEVKDKESVNIAIQMNDHHHHYTDGNQENTLGTDLAILHEAEPELAQQFLEVIKNEQEITREDQALDRAELEATIKDTAKIRELERRGQNYGMLLALTVMIFGAWALYEGIAWLAAIIFGTTIIGVLSVMVIGKKGETHKGTYPEQEEGE